MTLNIKPLSQLQRIGENRSKRSGVRFPRYRPAIKRIENRYAKSLDDYVQLMAKDIEEVFIPLVERLEPQYAPDQSKATTDGYVEELGRNLDLLASRWTISKQAATVLSSKYISEVDKETRTKLIQSVRNSMGVDVANVINSEGLNNAIDSSIRQNVRLISTIPEQFFDRIRQIVEQETVQGATGKSITKQIQEVYGITERRARVIARDQTNKLSGNLNRARQMSTGIRAYRWRTVGDEDVRDEHYKRNGKVFAWDKADVGKKLADGTVLLDPYANDIGHPGDDILCRCIAEPVIELDRLT